MEQELELPKLTFQVIRRTIATLAQKKGTVKDIQGVLRHSRMATTTDVYMQEIPESVQKTVDAISAELRLLPNLEEVTRETSVLLPNATKLKSGVSASNRKDGGPGRDRTDDLFHAMEARSQLRHRPTRGKFSCTILAHLHRLVKQCNPESNLRKANKMSILN